jgi:hypothetical protein
MAEAANHHTDSKRTVDDLFQFLIRVRDFRPAIAEDEILQAFRHDRLQLRYHIRGGTRKYNRDEFAPPQGIVGLIPYRSWYLDLLYFVLEEGRLIVRMNGAIDDYPWEATSFTVEGWSLVHDLWPPKSPISVPPAPHLVAEPPALELAPEPAVGSKMPRPAWLKAYLTKEKISELANKYDQVGKAAEAVNRDMEADPRVDAYKNPRSIEPFLIKARVYSPRQSRK